MDKKQKFKVEQIQPGMELYQPVNRRSNIVRAVRDYLKGKGRKRRRSPNRRPLARPYGALKGLLE